MFKLECEKTKMHMMNIVRFTNQVKFLKNMICMSSANMVANMDFTAFATGLLWSKHIFASYLR